ncbi:amino acid adenylation domain-containing protein [Streptosporangium sp. NPDC048047]|uniref:non-ribosomal peptide synthetase/MFS transporter n=1 Tax=Streptosporangium sp. NPDC048047 TaxID=3155748 RepID=UPI00342E8B06
MTELSEPKRALLARMLSGEDRKETIPRREWSQPPPLSYAQERLWFMEQYTPGSPALVIPVARRLRGPLDHDRLRGALRDLAARHEVLRTRFPHTDDGRPVAAVDGGGGAPVPLAVADAAGERDAGRLVDAFLAEPFDLAAGPPLRALLVRLAPGDHVLALAVHHIAADGWSISIMLRELMDLYAGRTPAETPIAYGDYAAWQRERPAQHDDLRYWAGRLAGAPPLDLPLDHPRPPQQTHDGATYGFRLDDGLAGAVQSLGQAHGATPYMTVLAAFAVVLGRLSRQTDLTIGSPVAGRSLPELEGLVGCFVNMLAMRVDLSGDPSFRELLLAVRDLALDAFTHENLPFEQLVGELNVERDTSRSPVFQVILAMQNYDGPQPAPREDSPAAPDEVTAGDFPLGRWATRYDLELYVTGESGMFVYNTALFDEATVGGVAGMLATVLRTAVADPDTPISALDPLTDAERLRVLHEWNDTAVDQGPPATLGALVEAQAERTPDAVAVTFDGGSLTYAELDERAGRIAGVLRENGAGPGSLVGVCAERSLELVPALLGVLKAGSAYVPLDPDYPADRLAFMIEDAGAPVLLTQEHLVPRLPGVTATVLTLDTPAAWPAPSSAPSPPPAARPGDPAYVIYTSGSTGRPKGVVNTHAGICNRLRWMQDRFRLGPDDVVLQKTPASFDVSVWEFFWPLITGARLVLARPGGHRDAAYLHELIAAEGVTTLHFVPSMLAAFLAHADADTDAGAGIGAGAGTGPDAGPARPRLAGLPVRRVICSGEELPVDLARRCLELIPAELHNLYGPTEAAVDVSAWRCTPEALAGQARVPIGSPVANTTLYVLDERMNPLPAGVPGELHIGGAQVATGYLGRPALTAERFVPDPYGPPGARLYRTGDLARLRRDGTLDFLGRIDGQVKLRGLRIEPGEIEAALRAQPGVDDAAVVVREDRPGDRRLVAYVVGEPPDRAALKRVLPDYMVPSATVAVEALPLTPNGKLDRRALPAPAAGRDDGAPFTEPSTPTERAVAEVWAQVLGTGRIGVDDDFFDLGGHSLLATQVIAKLRGSGVGVMDLFKNPTVRELAAVIDLPAAERAPRGLLHELTPRRTGTPALTFVCVPYGGGSAVVYKPLADALPADHALWSLAIPGHDVGLVEERLPLAELAERCVAEVLQKVEGPVALYGHCGVGSALTVEIARRLEAAGRRLEAVYIGAIFPFARPQSRAASTLARLARMESLRGDQTYANWLTSMGVDMKDLDPAQARQIIRNMRRDSEAAEEYFTGLLAERGIGLRAPIITVAGEKDPATDYYEERYLEWHFLTPVSAVVVLAEAGHFFLKYRADELAEIVTWVHTVLGPGIDDTTATGAADDDGTADGDAGTTDAGAVAATAVATAVRPRAEDADWWVHGVSRGGPGAAAPTGPQPSMRRFLLVALGQLASITGSALTEFALPIWIYLTTGSLARFALMAVAGLVPGLLVAPLAGALVDRSDRRRVMLAGDLGAMGTQLVLGALLWTGALESWHVYPLLAVLSVALTFQRVAYGSAIPQLVPKRNLGHANGVAQMAFGVAQLIVPLIAVGLMAAIGLGGILVLDILGSVVAVTILLLVRFPATMAWRRKEPLVAEIRNGFRYSWGQPGLRGMLIFFAVLNVFLSPLFLMISPLVLSFASLDDAGTVAFVSGLGAFLGGLLMTFWGGPRHRRMRGMLALTAALAGFCLLTGARPDLWLIAAGAGGMALCLALVNGVYTTIIQVKVPQRFHGRVFALNTMIAWSTLPIGFGLVAPYGAAVFEPLMAPGQPLADTLGVLIGVGEGRGIGLMYVTFALAMAMIVATALRTRTLARFDREVPDAPADDLVGRQALLSRRGAR